MVEYKKPSPQRCELPVWRTKVQVYVYSFRTRKLSNSLPKRDKNFKKHRDLSFEATRIDIWNTNDWNWTNSVVSGAKNPESRRFWSEILLRYAFYFYFSHEANLTERMRLAFFFSPQCKGNENKGNESLAWQRYNKANILLDVISRPKYLSVLVLWILSRRNLNST